MPRLVQAGPVDPAHCLQGLLGVIEWLVQTCRLLFASGQQPRPEAEGARLVPQDDRRKQAHEARYQCEALLQSYCEFALDKANLPDGQHTWQNCDFEAMLSRARSRSPMSPLVTASFSYVRDVGNRKSHPTPYDLTALELGALLMTLLRIVHWYAEDVLGGGADEIARLRRERAARAARSGLHENALLWRERFWSEAKNGRLTTFSEDLLATIAERLDVSRDQQEEIRNAYNYNRAEFSERLKELSLRAADGGDLGPDTVETVERQRVRHCVAQEEATKLWQELCVGVRLEDDVGAPGWMKAPPVAPVAPRAVWKLGPGTLLAVLQQGFSADELQAALASVNTPGAPRSERHTKLLALLLYHSMGDSPESTKQYLNEWEAAR